MIGLTCKNVGEGDLRMRLKKKEGLRRKWAARFERRWESDVRGGCLRASRTKSYSRQWDPARMEGGINPGRKQRG